MRNDTKQFKLNIWLWVIIIANCVLDIVLFHRLGIKITIIEPYKFAFLLTVMLAIAAVSYLKKNENLFYFGNVAGQLIMINLSAGLLQYAGPTFCIPLVDKTLIHIDRFFGFDWLSFMKWVDTLNPVFIGSLCASYMLIVLFAAFIMCVLFAYERHIHAQRLFIVLYSGVIACIVLSAVFPAVAGYVFYNLTTQDFQNLDPTISRLHEQLYLGLYHHTIHEIKAPGVGIITFPSYHTVMALALVYGSWPLKRLRWFIISLSILILIATLVVGGHYLTDVIGGAMLAVAGAYLAHKLLPDEKKAGAACRI